MGYLKNDEIDFIQKELGEASTLSKLVYYHLFEVAKTRSLTDKEKEIDDLAHKVHQHVNSTYVYLEGKKSEKKRRDYI